MMRPVAASDQNLILAGYVGSGGLAVMRRAAERLRMVFVDFDRLLENRIGLPADDIRAIYGETRLKSVEAELIDELALYRSHALHISGQTLMHSNHLAHLAATGPVICLVASLDAVLQRLHLTLGARYHDPAEREIALGALRREWALRNCPGVVEIDASYLSDDELVESIAARWRAETGVLDWR